MNQGSGIPKHIPQYKILFIHNGSQDDKIYWSKKYVQSQMAKINFKPDGKLKSKIVAVVLVVAGTWFEAGHLQFQWALGSYLHVIAETFPLGTPIEFKKGSQNMSIVTDKLWNQIISSNRDVLVKINSWLILHSAHLQSYKKYSDIRIKTLRHPWGQMIFEGRKYVENCKSNMPWKIDPQLELKWIKRVSCRDCVKEKEQCKSCSQVQGNIDQWKPKPKQKPSK